MRKKKKFSSFKFLINCRTDSLLTYLLTDGKVKLKLSLCLTKHHLMKECGLMEVWPHAFLTSALDGGEWSDSRPGRLTPEKQHPVPIG
jgi:hypothetical protein